MAVAAKPALVIADEPTTALDVTVQAQVLALLARLRAEVGCGVLLITHDLGVAAQISDRVAVMYAGRIVEVGQTRQVLEHPAHPYTVSLLRSRLALDSPRGRPLVSLSGGAPDPSALPAGCTFALRCPLAQDECRAAVPPALPLTDGHSVACTASRDAVDEYARSTAGLENAPARSPEEPAADEVAAERPPAVHARDLGVKFRIRQGRRGRGAVLNAVRGIDLDIPAGECLAIVGESGSGKSTLLRVLAGLTKHTGALDRDDAVRPQMVFQDAGASLTPWLKVGSMLNERLRHAGLPAEQRKERAYEALERTGLPRGVYDARPAELSGGQRQRVALARATVVPPSILLCDEPTSALDVSVAATVLNLIADLRRQFDMTVVFVTHDLAVARVISDRIAVMYLGRIVEIGQADELIRAPRHPYTNALIASVPGFEANPVSVIGEPASPIRPPEGCEYHPRCPVALEECSEAGRVVELEPPKRPECLHDKTSRMVACIGSQEVN